jgi:hypothetical protein
MEKITFKEVNGVTHFSCGCKAQKIGDNFIFAPCSATCPVTQYAMKEAQRQKKDIQIQVEKKMI